MIRTCSLLLWSLRICGTESQWTEADPEPESIIPSSKDALDAIQTLQMYILGWEDGSVLGSTIDLGWYQGIVQIRKDQEKYQTKISDFFRTGAN